MARHGIGSRPLPTLSWRVVSNRLCVPLSSTEDLLSDTTALLEDIRATIAESSKLIAEANRLVAEARGGGKRGGWRHADFTPAPRGGGRSSADQSD